MQNHPPIIQSQDVVPSLSFPALATPTPFLPRSFCYCFFVRRDVINPPTRGDITLLMIAEHRIIKNVEEACAFSISGVFFKYYCLIYQGSRI